MQYLPLLIFAVLCIVGLFRPAWAMVLLLVMFALKVAMQAGIDIFRAQPALTNFMVAGVVFVAAMSACLRTPRPLLGYATPWLLMVVSILLWSIMSLLWTPAVATGPNVGSNIIVEGFPYFILSVLLGPLLVSSIQDWRGVTNLMLVIGSCVALSIVVSPEFTIQQGRIGFKLEGAQRTSPLAIAQMGGMLAIFGALSAGGRATGLQTAMRFGAFLCGALITLMSGTRGQAIFALGTIAVFLPASRRLRNVGSYFSLILVAGVISIGAYLTFMYALGQADTDRWSAGAITRAAEGRQWSALMMLNEFIASPASWIQGMGYNAFSAMGGVGELGYVHNLYVEVLSELGIPAFLLLVMVFVRAGMAAKTLYASARHHSTARSAVSILMAMIVYQALIATKEGNLWSAWNLFAFMLILIRLEMRARELGDPLLEQSEDLGEEAFEEEDAELAAESEPTAAGQPA